ncbi:hypothetical protein L3X38_042620 [Prunus dulcis]|uniref:Uncharacterized protein n=1 Tax=Prunus dulcis TaxID=3755 RepID=A0AAD4UWM4_PRUDU|nr:hypothetical protein L3X38_042620 [Prunus dulcis]
MLAVTKIQAKQNMEDNDALYEMLLENNTSSIFMLPEPSCQTKLYLDSTQPLDYPHPHSKFKLIMSSQVTFFQDLFHAKQNIFQHLPYFKHPSSIHSVSNILPAYTLFQTFFQYLAIMSHTSTFTEVLSAKFKVFGGWCCKLKQNGESKLIAYATPRLDHHYPLTRLAHVK